MANSSTRVLVTGATGYIAIHCVEQLLKQEYLVRGTVRQLNNASKMKPLRDLECSERMEIVEADLNSDDHWNQVIEDCNYILHVASPFTFKTDKSIVSTAVDGTLRVLKAAANSKTVKKIVLTSSIAAISEGHADKESMMSEADWTNLESNQVDLYSRSKTMAERAAWEFVKNTKDIGFKLTVLNPVFVIGPALKREECTSYKVIKRFLDGTMPAYPEVQMGLVDVRDVARAHIMAMQEPKTDGERIILSAQPPYWFAEIANILAEEFSPQGYRVSRFRAPYPFIWLHSLFSDDSRSILQKIGHRINFDTSKAQNLLNIDFVDPKQSLIEMAYDIIERGALYKAHGYHGPPKS